jgi:hypothetical protein
MTITKPVTGLAITNTQESPSTEPAKRRPRSSIASLAGHFARAGITLRRTEWGDGPVKYIAMRNGRAHEFDSLSDVAQLLRILWVIGDLRA